MQPTLPARGQGTQAWLRAVGLHRGGLSMDPLVLPLTERHDVVLKCFLIFNFSCLVLVQLPLSA